MINATNIKLRSKKSKKKGKDKKKDINKCNQLISIFVIAKSISCDSRASIKALAC